MNIFLSKLTNILRVTFSLHFTQKYYALCSLRRNNARSHHLLQGSQSVTYSQQYYDLGHKLVSFRFAPRSHSPPAIFFARFILSATSFPRQSFRIVQDFNVSTFLWSTTQLLSNLWWIEPNFECSTPFQSLDKITGFGTSMRTGSSRWWYPVLYEVSD